MNRDDPPRRTVRELADDPTAPDATIAARGFRASLRGASMFDVIQLECAHRRRAVVCVRSGARVGYLYFDGGDIIHASAGATVGKDAVFEILRWQSGTASPCERSWPAQPSIAEPTPALLLRAAHHADEGERAGHHRFEVSEPPAGELIPFARPSAPAAPAPLPAPPSTRLRRVPRASSPPPTAPPAETVTGTAGATRHAPHAEAAPKPAPERASPSAPRVLAGNFSVDPTACVAAAVVDDTGEVIAGLGNSDDLAPVAAYAAELARLIGADLGLDPFSSLHARLGTERELVLKDLGDAVGIALGAPGVHSPAGERR